MDCKTCKDIRKQADGMVSRYAFESALVSFDKTVKRLWIVIILLIALLFGTNAAWVWYESQFVEESVWQEVDTGNGDAFIAGIGDVNYGQNSAENDTPDS